MTFGTGKEYKETEDKDSLVYTFLSDVKSWLIEQIQVFFYRLICQLTSHGL